MARNSNSALVTYINLFAEHTPENKDVLSQIVSDITPTENQARSYMTTKQINSALNYPYSNIRSVIATKADYFTKLDRVIKEEKICLQMMERANTLQNELDILKQNATPEEQNKINEQEAKLIESANALQAQVNKLKKLKEQLNEWRSALENKMKEHRKKWIQLREKLNDGAINAVEKVTGVKLTQDEIAQLNKIESLESIYKRYEALKVKPPIAYEDAQNNSQAFILLKAYIVSQEAKYRDSIH